MSVYCVIILNEGPTAFFDMYCFPHFMAVDLNYLFLSFFFG